MFVSAWPVAEYTLEIPDLNPDQVYEQKKIINLARSRYGTLLPCFGRSKGSSKSIALVGHGGRGYGGNSGRAHGG